MREVIFAAGIASSIVETLLASGVNCKADAMEERQKSGNPIYKVAALGKMVLDVGFEPTTPTMSM